MASSQLLDLQAKLTLLSCCVRKYKFLATVAMICLNSSLATAQILVDDFSEAQEGISTDQHASYDTIEFESPIGEYRELWGGGASVDGNCETTEMAVSISNGTMAVTNGPDCYGAGHVRWLGSETADISQYSSLRLQVAEIVGDITMRISIARDLLGARQLDATLDRTGEYLFFFDDFNRRFGDPGGLDEVRMINIGFGVDQGE